MTQSHEGSGWRFCRRLLPHSTPLGRSARASITLRYAGQVGDALCAIFAGHFEWRAAANAVRWGTCASLPFQVLPAADRNREISTPCLRSLKCRSGYGVWKTSFARERHGGGLLHRDLLRGRWSLRGLLLGRGKATSALRRTPSKWYSYRWRGACQGEGGSIYLQGIFSGTLVTQEPAAGMLVTQGPAAGMLVTQGAAAGSW
jgi:hypothetical protein